MIQGHNISNNQQLVHESVWLWSVSEELLSLTCLCLVCNSYIFSHLAHGLCVSVCVYVRVGKRMRLLVGTLYSRAVVAALFVRAVIVSLPAVTRWRALADVIILQVDLLRVSTDDGWLWPWGQHVFQLLHRENNFQNTALTGSFIGISTHSLVSEGCGVMSALLQGERERARRGAVSGRNSLPSSARKTSVTEFKYFHIHHKEESNRWMEVWMKLISFPPSLKQRQQTNRSYFLFRPKPDYVTDSEDIVEKIIWENMHLGFLPTNRTHINCFPPKKNSSPTCEHVTGQTANSLLSCLKIMYIFQVKAAVVQSKVCCGLSPSTLLPIFPFFLACFKAANKRANLFTASVCCHHWCPLRGLMGKSDLNNIFELNCKWLADLSLFGI